MLGDGGGTEVRRDRAELVITHERAGQREARESQRVNNADARPREGGCAGCSAQEPHVEGGVVSDEDRSSTEVIGSAFATIAGVIPVSDVMNGGMGREGFTSEENSSMMAPS